MSRADRLAFAVIPLGIGALALVSVGLAWLVVL